MARRRWRFQGMSSTTKRVAGTFAALAATAGTN
jgi:hypothetical protein